MSDNLYDVVVVGSGPAGLTAAIYTSRARLKTLIISGLVSGGQLMDTTDVENYPGFPGGILGPDLMEKFKSQALSFGAEMVPESVDSVSGSFSENFTIETDAGNKYRTKSVIIATGASAKWLGLESEQRLKGKGVSACATCDGYFFKDKVVAVVGAGDAAMEEANFLTKFAGKVYILARKGKDEMKASKIMQERALVNPKIRFIFNTEILEVLGEDQVTGLKVVNNLTGEESVLDDIGGLFVSIGHTPNTDFLKGLVELDEMGYVRLYNHTKSSVEGVFVAGDVADFRYRQAVTAAGFGCMAALDVEKFLAERSG
jgi:thioredoxin reductase (NADPH)